MNKHELIVKTIRESNLSIQQWADQIGMHRNQVQNWLSGRTTNIRDSSVVAVGKVISKKPRFNESGVEWIELDQQQIEVKEIKMSVNAERIIENQQTTIDLLKEKIANLEKQLKKNDGYLDMMKNEPKCKRCLDIIGKA